ncbi:zinc finger protein 239-like [Heterodontus francisci]|uniref:zinc finger protein 239-like n=1 Tax=Heterodontus francisci TaxID=7792 RepID=UPI00355B0043
MGERPFTCSECGKRFPQSSKLLMHHEFTPGGYHSSAHCQEKIHSVILPADTKSLGKRFTLSFYLLIHQRVITLERPFNTTECGQRFTQSSYQLIHHCSECGMKFTQSSFLLIQKCVHTGERPFTCSECGQRFTQSS